LFNILSFINNIGDPVAGSGNGIEIYIFIFNQPLVNILYINRETKPGVAFGYNCFVFINAFAITYALKKTFSPLRLFLFI